MSEVKPVYNTHQEYLQGIGLSLRTNPRHFWSYIKICRSTPKIVPVLKVGDQVLSEDGDKAEALNLHFQSVFKNESEMVSQLPLSSCANTLDM